MKILKVIANAKCDFCAKEHEVCEVENANGRKSLLCWKDLQKLARMELKELDRVHNQTSGK